MSSDNQPIRKIEIPSNDGAQKRADTSGRATAELISELQKRGISKGVSSDESEN